MTLYASQAANSVRVVTRPGINEAVLRLCYVHNCDNHDVKGALYRIWCGMNRLGESGVNRLGDISAFVTPAGQLLLPGGVRPECIPSA